jgi:L-lactate dehydrogenase
MLSQDFNVDARNIHTYIIGEHGDSEIATWSSTSVAGMQLNEYCNVVSKTCNTSYKQDTVNEVRNAAYEIIKKKGSTYYAVALAVKRIVEAILRDENSILTVSTLLKGEYGIEDIYIGVPSVVGSSGVKKVLEIPLNVKESSALKTSADTLKNSLNKANI